MRISGMRNQTADGHYGGEPFEVYAQGVEIELLDDDAEPDTIVKVVHDPETGITTISVLRNEERTDVWTARGQS